MQPVRKSVVTKKKSPVRAANPYAQLYLHIIEKYQ